MKKKIFIFIFINLLVILCGCENNNNNQPKDISETSYFFDIVKFKDPKLAAYIPAGIVTDENGEKRYIIELFCNTPDHFLEYYNELKQGDISYKLHNDYCIVKYSNLTIVQTKFLWSDLDELCSKMLSFENYTLNGRNVVTHFCLPPEYIESDENIFAERHRINGLEFMDLLESKDILYNPYETCCVFPYYTNFDPYTFTIPYTFPDGRTITHCWNKKHPANNSICRTIDELREDCINCLNEIIDNNDFERYDYYLKDQIR